MKKLLIALCLSAIFAGCTTPKQALYDAEVDRLCASEAAVRVYESVTLSNDRFDSRGFLKGIASINFEGSLGPDYIYSLEDTAVAGGTSESASVILKHTSKIIRKSDGKVLGESVYFSRYGGDFLPGFQPSHYGCPPTVGITSAVFKKASAK